MIGAAMKCRNHPEREAVAVCQKLGTGFCATCCECPDAAACCGCLDPAVYCQFRTGCLIWEAARERRRKQADTA
jgi:hypothetical protein